MKKIDVGQAIGIIANVGVIAGILLLAYELRQNNDLMEAEARFNRLIANTEFYTIMTENPDLADVWWKAYEDERLSAAERRRLDAFMMRAILIREWSFKELPRSELPVGRWQRNFERLEPMRTVWEREKGDLDPDFVEWWEGIRSR